MSDGLRVVLLVTLLVGIMLVAGWVDALELERLRGR